MRALRLFALIGALMLSAALVCSAGMVGSTLLSGMGSLTLSDAVSAGAETAVLLGLVIWLRSTLGPARAHQR
jgi:hypothetical protein